VSTQLLLVTFSTHPREWINPVYAPASTHLYRL